jgi:hypothetical protein
MDSFIWRELKIGRLHLGIGRAGASPPFGWRRIVWRLWYRIEQKRYKRLP